jgi:transcriptional regulator GlxA family with amidase domain
MPSPAVHHVVALALPDVVAFDLSVPAQVFGHRTERGRYAFTVCAQRPGPVPSTTGFALQAGAGLAALRTADTVIVPGFWPLDDPPRAVLDALRHAAARGARVASVCTGAFALGAAGLLDGRVATTHWQHAAEFAGRFPAVRLRPDALYADEGQLLTSAGVAAGIDLCLHLYRNDHGAEAAAGVARRMVAAVHRPAARPSSCSGRCRAAAPAWPGPARGRSARSTGRSPWSSSPATPGSRRAPSPGASWPRPA